jgi:hypothetical protein
MSDGTSSSQNSPAAKWYYFFGNIFGVRLIKEELIHLARITEVEEIAIAGHGRSRIWPVAAAPLAEKCIPYSLR